MQAAEEERRLKDLNNAKFRQGKSAYSTGQYMASMILFQEALQKEGEYSALGGEIQLWLALAYQVSCYICFVQANTYPVFIGLLLARICRCVASSGWH